MKFYLQKILNVARRLSCAVLHPALKTTKNVKNGQFLPKNAQKTLKSGKKC